MFSAISATQLRVESVFGSMMTSEFDKGKPTRLLLEVSADPDEFSKIRGT
jgi:hypothetical protein